MLLHYFYDRHLAQASYLIGCQATGQAIVIDPSRDVSPYFTEARRHGLRIVGVAETHIHADYVSGARELAERGATLYLSDCAQEPWKYRYARGYAHRLLRGSEQFSVGNLRLTAAHTPGHTPEHLSFILTDTPASSEPMGIFTGDFVFVGSVGRPDLLEKAAGELDSAVKGAKQMARSLEWFRTLPDYLQLFPGHGAGSACGKGLGSVPSSTVGYEKIANPFLRPMSEDKFVRTLLEGQPEPPTYFDRMKRVNRDGPRLLSTVTSPKKVGLDALLAHQREAAVLLDTRPTDEFARGHLPGSLNIPARSLGEWAGWLLPYDRPVVVIIPDGSEDAVFQPLRAIGLDNVAAFASAAVLEEVGDHSVVLQSYDEIDARKAAHILGDDAAILLDVRSQSEWDESRLPDAHHIMLGTLPERLGEVPTNKPIILQCRSGNRSGIAASILQANGILNVLNLSGGIQAWKKQGLPVQ